MVNRYSTQNLPFVDKKTPPAASKGGHKKKKKTKKQKKVCSFLIEGEQQLSVSLSSVTNNWFQQWLWYFSHSENGSPLDSIITGWIQASHCHWYQSVRRVQNTLEPLFKAAGRVFTIWFEIDMFFFSPGCRYNVIKARADVYLQRLSMNSGHSNTDFLQHVKRANIKQCAASVVCFGTFPAKPQICWKFTILQFHCWFSIFRQCCTYALVGLRQKIRKG